MTSLRESRDRVALILATIGFLTLVTNRIPMVTVSLFACAAVMAIRKPDMAVGWVLAIWGFWVLSFLMTAESLSVLWSFSFQRRDGQIFFSLLPLVAFAWLSPPRDKIQIFFGLFCLLQAGVILVGLIGYIGHWEEDLVGWVYRREEGITVGHPFAGLYMAHNAAGSVHASCCLVAAVLTILGREAKQRWFWGIMAVFLLWGVLLSQARGALLALGVALVLLVIMAVRRKHLHRRAVLYACVAALVTGVLIGPTPFLRWAEFMRDSGTHTDRLTLWKRGIQEWTWSPLVGEGLGRYNDLDRQWSGVKHVFYPVTRAQVVNASSHAHNSYIHFLAEGGLIGLGLCAGFWLWIAWKLRRSREPLRIAGGLAILFLFVISLTEHYMGGGVMLLVLSSLMGAVWNLPDSS